jgi:hypothetical protein
VLKYHAMKTYWGSGDISTHFNLGTSGDKWSAPHSRPLYPAVKADGNQWTVSLVGPKSSLDTVGKGRNTCPCRESNPDRSAHSQVSILTDPPPPTHTHFSIVICFVLEMLTHGGGGGELFTGFWLTGSKVRVHGEDLGVGGRITLRWTLGRWDRGSELNSAGSG